MRGLLYGVAGSLWLAVPAAYAVDLVGHNAHYALSLESSKGDVEAANGSMTYEMIDACEGWAVHQHLDMTLISHEGQPVKMVSDYNTYEAKDGLSMRFRMHQVTDGEAADDVVGNARLDSIGGKGEVTYTVPATDTKTLPAGTVFPTMHTLAILSAAQQGKKYLNLPLFDGTSANGGQTSSVTMSGWNKAPARTELAPLAAVPSGRVRIAFFDSAKDDGADGQQPDYEVAMRYWANGVADEMSMDFGDFTVLAKIDKLIITKPGC